MKGSAFSATRTAGLLTGLLLAACTFSSIDVPKVSGSELAARIADGSAPFILDVRSAEEFEEGHIPGAVLIPYDELERRLPEISANRDAEVVVYCRSGRRAGIAEEILVAAGYSNVKDLEGHMLDWREAELPVARQP